MSAEIISVILLGLLFAGLSPLYGKLADMLGRKVVLFSSIGIFLFGSAMCGAAQSFIWLVLCQCIACSMFIFAANIGLITGRGVQGIGGGGLIQARGGAGGLLVHSGAPYAGLWNTASARVQRAACAWASKKSGNSGLFGVACKAFVARWRACAQEGITGEGERRLVRRAADLV